MNDKVLRELRAKMKAAEAASQAADAIWRQAQQEYADAISAAIGLSVGSVVTTTSRVGYGEEAATRTTRLRVEKITYKGYSEPPLGLYGRVIRKDGTPGEKKEIWQQWKLETSDSASLLCPKRKTAQSL